MAKCLYLFSNYSKSFRKAPLFLLLKPHPEEGSDAPLDILNGEVILITDVGEIEYHREAEKFVAPLMNDCTAPSDDDLREMVVERHFGIAESH